MDAVIQVEASTLTLRTRYSFVELVIVLGETLTTASTWITVFIDKLKLIKRSLWANAPNEEIPHINMVLI